ncbi:Cmx/CmrA family chloramphenicol efflux MFS transporter [Streptomyces sp. NPDC048172]|uniref:Cmx/CmrA family chloramphenicol efflux MFS transporter n=1 Tax=Streptomyces sp. NPDC048172 TaxID=3365505 RepID=UPI003722CACA
MPFAVYVLGLAVFAQGTSEFMLAGLVPGIAEDLGVSLGAAGLLTSGFAVGMAVGAPLMALFSRNWPRRSALLVFLGVFVAVHVVGALTPNYEVLLATRVLAAVANAGFWAVAMTTAVGMVDDRHKARATSVVVGGVTIACVAGVPAGAVLGGEFGWRAAFWAVALVSLPAVLALARAIPGGRPAPSRAGARDELRVLARPQLLLTLLMMALVQGATFCTFTYLATLVTEVTGLAEGWVPGVLALFGVGSFVGVTVGGRVIDARPVGMMVAGMVALTVGWTALALGAGSAAVVLPLVFVQGMLAFGTGPALITRALRQAEAAPTLSGGYATAAFNVGATLGPWLGGTALGGALGIGLGHRAPAWVSAALMLAALAVVALALGTARRRVRTAAVA